MDARKERLGAQRRRRRTALGGQRTRRCPEDPVARIAWQQRSASIGAYRELAGYNHPVDPIGPEPPLAART
jgi:hypothetical protein